MDGDGDLDAFVANRSQPNEVWLNDGAGNFSDSGQSMGSAESWTAALGDLDGDGDLDAFVGNSVANRVWLNDGTGVFTDTGQSLSQSGIRELTLGDVDGDGDLDAVTANAYHVNKVWLNDGTGVFSDSGQNLGSTFDWSVALGDVDGDDDLDVFIGSMHGNEVWLNNGAGHFSDSGQSMDSLLADGVALGDLDGDGDLDAFVVNSNGNTPSKVWLNQDESAVTTRVITYVYDPLGRLVEANYSTGERFEYAYDEVGNRTAMTETTSLAETTVTTYTYDAANRLLVSSSPGHLVAYDWDDRGNLTHDGTFTYMYSAAGRMVRAESITETIIYTYTSDGLRVGQNVDGVETTFVWDWAAGLPEMLSEGGNLYLVGHDTLGYWNGGEWTYYLPDALGSVRQTTDGAGAVMSSREWTPFGVEVGAAQAGLGYTGEYWDSYMNRGMLYLRARWYEPQTARFISPDPIIPNFQNPQSINRYAYAFGNPTNYIDPSGHTGVDGSRAQLLQTHGLELHDDSGINAMSKFIQFTQYAASLYSNFETTQYVIDVTAVIHGHEYDSDSYEPFYQYRDDHSSEYWARMGAFDQEEYYTGPRCKYPGLCDKGWHINYRDDTGNQAYHFWFYVAVAYFDGTAAAMYGNARHELEPRGTWKDFLLGLKGVELGSKLADRQSSLDQLLSPCLYEEWKWALAGAPPSQVPEWLISHLWDGETPLQLQ